MEAFGHYHNQYKSNVTCTQVFVIKFYRQRHAVFDVMMDKSTDKMTKEIAKYSFKVKLEQLYRTRVY